MASLLCINRSTYEKGKPQFILIMYILKTAATHAENSFTKMCSLMH